MKVKEAYGTLNRLDKPTNHLSAHNNQNNKLTELRKDIKNSKGITPEFSMENLKVRLSWIDVLQKTNTTDSSPD